MRTSEGQAKVTMYSWGLGMKKLPDAQQHPSTIVSIGPRYQLGKRTNDPYEFYDENHIPIAVDGAKGKDDIKVSIFALLRRFFGF